MKRLNKEGWMEGCREIYCQNYGYEQAVICRFGINIRLT